MSDTKSLELLLKSLARYLDEFERRASPSRRPKKNIRDIGSVTILWLPKRTKYVDVEIGA